MERTPNNVISFPVTNTQPTKDCEAGKVVFFSKHGSESMFVFFLTLLRYPVQYVETNCLENW